MTTEEQLYQALEAADAKGDAEAIDFFTEQIRRRVWEKESPKTVALPPEETEAQRVERLRKEGTEGAMKLVTQPIKEFGLGVASTPARVGLSAAKLADKAGFRLPGKDLFEQYAAPPDTTAGRIGAGVGDVGLMMSPVAMARIPGAVGRGVEAGSSFVARHPFTAVPAVGAATGAVLAPENPWMGALFGAAGNVLGRGFAGFEPQRGVRDLIDVGVIPSPGQAFGGRLEAIESKLGRMPVSGETVRGTRENARRQYQQATRDLVEPGAMTIEEARQAASQGYDRILNGVGWNQGFRPGTSSAAIARRATQNVRGLSPEQVARLEADVENAMTMGGGQTRVQTPAQFQGAESDLKQKLADLAGSKDPGDKAYARALRRAVSEIRNSWRNAVHPDVRDALAEQDRVWGNFMPIQRASQKAASTLSEAENYTPKDVLRAGRKVSGEGYRQTPQGMLARDAERVLGSNPITSTELGGWAELLNTAGGLPFLAGQLARPGMTRFLTGSTSWQRPLSGALRVLGTEAGPQMSFPQER